MIYVSPIQTFDHKLARESKVLAHAQGFLIYIFCREVLCDATIVCVRELCCVDFIIEEVIDVYIIHISLDGLEVNVLRFLLPSRTTRLPDTSLDGTIIRLSGYWATILSGRCILFVFIFLLGVVLISFFQPWVTKYLRDGQTFTRVQFDHATHDSLGLVTEVNWEREITFQDKLVQVF